MNYFKKLPLYDIVKKPKNYSFAYFITFVTLLVMLFEPNSSSLLRYQSTEVNAGEWWRILTANLCHSNWNHWLLNIAGLWLMDIFYQPVLSLKKRFQLILFCMFVNVLMIHYWMSISWYVGLSGMLHGYLIGGALLSWSKARWLNFGIILVTSVKLFIESFWEINSATEELINANVLEESHSFGALSAVIFWLIYSITSKLRHQKSD
jgi:rhomboid family GlyGly-CTERM serine protease